MSEKKGNKMGRKKKEMFWDMEASLQPKFMQKWLLKRR